MTLLRGGGGESVGRWKFGSNEGGVGFGEEIQRAEHLKGGGDGAESVG